MSSGGVRYLRPRHEFESRTPLPHNLPRPRVLLADDRIDMHEAITCLLAATCDVIGAVSDGTDLLRETERLRPDVVVVDLNMPKLNGIDACRRIRATTPSVQVIVLTAHDEPEIKKRAFQLGAAGFVVKMRAHDELPIAVQDACAGRSPSTAYNGV